MPTIPIEEYIVFALLLLGVVGIYYALKFHYIFAFKLVQKTSISATKKQKIDKIKYYVFAFLKVLLGAGLVFVAIFSTMLLMEGLSLKHFVIDVLAGASIGALSSYYFTTTYKGFIIEPKIKSGLLGITFTKKLEI
jgi:hypothetical protein